MKESLVVMAAAPVKSQPLHNFSLPYLKWGHKNQVNANHRYRRPSESVFRESPSPRRISPPAGQDSDGGSGRGDGSKSEPEAENGKPPVGSRAAPKNRFSFASCSPQKQQVAGLEREGEEMDGEREKQKASDEVDAEESLAKPWNLRPRKAAAKAAAEIGGFFKDGEFREIAPAQPAHMAVAQAENLPKSMRLRGFAEGQGSEKKEKRKFWITLSREEIEEDVYAMTGGKAARRPKKRPKTVQKQLDVSD